MPTNAASFGNAPSRSDRLWLGAILFIAAVFRFYEMGFPDIWVDEANLILTAARPIGSLLAQLGVDSSPPLYYLAIHFWMGVVGDSAIALRLLSVLSGVALVAAVWWVGRDLVSENAGRWAAFYIAVNPSQSFFSQQVRMYVWLGLFALLSLVALVRFLRDGRRRDFALWIATSILALYNHNFSIHLGIAFAVLIALSGQLATRIRFWAIAAVIVAVSYTPWIPTLLDQLANDDHYAWFLPLWDSLGVVGTIGRSLRSLSPSVEFLNYAGIGSFKMLWGIPTYAAGSLALIGVWSSIGQIRQRGAAVALGPTVGFVAPIVSASLLSLLVTPHFVPGRVDQMMLPMYALLVGAGIAHLRPTGLRVGIGAGILLLAVVAKVQMYDVYRDPELSGGDRTLAGEIIEAWRPSDVIVTTSLSRASLEYYLGRQHRRDPSGPTYTDRILSFPRSGADHLGAQNDARLLADKAGLMREAAAVLGEARSRAGAEGRVFIVWVHSPVNYPLREGAVESYGYVEAEPLSRFRQFGTGLIMELRQYRPR